MTAQSKCWFNESVFLTRFILTYIYYSCKALGWEMIDSVFLCDPLVRQKTSNSWIFFSKGTPRSPWKVFVGYWKNESTTLNDSVQYCFFIRYKRKNPMRFQHLIDPPSSGYVCRQWKQICTGPVSWDLRSIFLSHHNNQPPLALTTSMPYCNLISTVSVVNLVAGNGHVFLDLGYTIAVGTDNFKFLGFIRL